MALSALKIEAGEGLRNLELLIKALKGKELRVGFPKAARYPRKDIERQIAKERHGSKYKRKSYQHPRSSTQGELVAHVALKQETGIGVPARPFIRPTIQKRQKVWVDTFSKASRQALQGKRNPKTIYELVGLQMSTDMQKEISSIWSPPLAESTIQARIAKYKKRVRTESITKPLEDTGYMRASLTSEVV